MGAFDGDSSVEAMPFSAVVDRGDRSYLMEVARLTGGVYAAGFSDLVTSVRFGWHADLGVLLDFATHFNPPNFYREADLPGRLNEVFLRHRRLDEEARREAETGVRRMLPHAYLMGHGGRHATVVLLRHGWDAFSLRAVSELRPRDERDADELATSRHAEPLLRAMEAIVRAGDREATRQALAAVPATVSRWRHENLGEPARRPAVA